jgi:hypothetical protein
VDLVRRGGCCRRLSHRSWLAGSARLIQGGLRRCVAPSMWIVAV